MNNENEQFAQTFDETIDPEDVLYGDFEYQEYQKRQIVRVW